MPLILWFCMFFATLVQSQEWPVLNQECTNRQSCGPFGYVCGTNKTCQCDRFFVPDRNQERCVGGLDQRCKYDDDCIRGAFCQHQMKCKCKDNHFPSEDGLTCSGSPSLKYSKLVLFPSVIIIVLLNLYQL